ncbi:MAG TPA: cytochrome C [Granulicella sp.]|jgi:thiosulfate dehydrogenase|nr:cytochrome C [Granulicella sp.]
MRGIRCIHAAPLFASVALALICWIASGCSGHSTSTAQANAADPQHAAVVNPQQTKLIHQGQLIFDETPKYAGSYVGNKLACSDCHIQSGTAAYAAPMTDLAGLFPMFNKRAGHVISLQNRIQECFSRSEAGRPVPENSPEMKELVAYVNWLSRDGVKGKAYKGRGFVKLPTLIADPGNGRSVYASQCTGCHGSDGAGVPRYCRRSGVPTPTMTEQA